MVDHRRAVAVLALLLAGACAASTAREFSAQPATSVGRSDSIDAPLVTGLGGLRIASPAFAPGGPLPDRYLANAPEPVSPALEWAGVVNAAAELALVVVDERTDEPIWVVAGISPDSGSIAEGRLPAGATELSTPRGPGPWPGVAPGGAGTIRFSVLVLDQPADVDAAAVGESAAAVLERRAITAASLTAQVP